MIGWVTHCCELVHGHHRKDKQDKDDQSDDQAYKCVDASSSVVMNVTIPGLYSQFGSEEDPLIY